MECNGRGRLLKYAGGITLLFFLCLQGCSEKEVYSRFTDESSWKNPGCITLPDSLDGKMMREILDAKGYPGTADCSYALELFIGKSSCPPEKGGSVGFIRLELTEDKKSRYRIQAEFWEGEKKETIRLLLRRMAEEFALRSQQPPG